MQFISTRSEWQAVGFSAALRSGLAPDGGLYIPQQWPAMALPGLGAGESLAPLAAKFLAPFAAGDALEPALGAICAEAFDFPAPLLALEGERLGVLELFHGPTAAFKDFGARFLAAALTQLRKGAARTLQI